MHAISLVPDCLVVVVLMMMVVKVAAVRFAEP